MIKLLDICLVIVIVAVGWVALGFVFRVIAALFKFGFTILG